MIRLTWKQFSHATAILAVLLLCAQSLATAHSHDLIEDGVCAVCAASTDHGIISAAGITVPTASWGSLGRRVNVDRPDTRSTFKPRSRAPPTA